MADSSKKVSELPITTNVFSTDRVLVLYNTPNVATQSVRTITITDLAANMSPYLPNTVTVVVNTVISNTVPATRTSNGSAGTIAYDSQYLYVCISNNSWLRTHLLSW